MLYDKFDQEALEVFRLQLHKELQEYLNLAHTEPKKWLKSKDVVKMLNICSKTLQTYRNKGLIPYSKIGKSLFYANTDIENLLLINRNSNN